MNEQIFKKVFELSAVGLAIQTIDGKWIEVNRGMTQILGYDINDFIKISFKEITYANDQEKDIELKYQLLNGEIDSYKVEKRIYHKDRHVVWVVMHVCLVRLSTEGDEFVLYQIEDISDLKKSKVILNQRVRDLLRYKKAVDFSFNHIIITDQDGIILYANAAAEKQTGYSFDEMKGQTPRLWGGLMEKGFYEKMWQSIKVEKQPFRGELENKRKNSELYYVILTISPILDNEDEVIGFIGIEEDITKIKQVEKLKDEFLSMASHELRTPLASIDGLIDMVRKGEYGEISDEVRTALDDVNKSSERLIHLVNDLLNISRMQAGKLKFDFTDFDLKDLILENIKMFEAICSEKNLDLVCDNLVEVDVQADEEKICQVLNNLFNNAFKFTDIGKIIISLKIEEEMAIVYVTDTGIGIEEDFKRKVFKRFEQAKVQGDRPTGSGLGLYIAREIMLKMGGDLWLEWSILGEGSCFAFSCPISETKLADKVSMMNEKGE